MTYTARGVTVSYGGTNALEDVTAVAEPGSVLAVVGGDGAGKTTLMRTMVGELTPTIGAVDIPGPDRIGYLPASAGSWAALTARQNLDFVGGIYGLAGAALTSRREELLGRADLTGAGDRLASQLSGGMRRKLGFCMAMLHDPPLLVLDEPSTGVDPVSRVDLWRLVSEAAAAGAAVVMSTTYLDEAERAGALLALDDGRVLAAGGLADVVAAFDGVITRASVPVRPGWSWRRGRAHHECWPHGTSAPAGAEVVAPDLEDVIVALSLESRARDVVST